MFRIRFQGLLTHADLSGQVVVIYKESGHRAIVTVREDDLIDTNATPVGDNDPDLPRVLCFRLHGNIQLHGVEQGPVQKNLSGLPSLIDLCDGTKMVREEIIYRRPHNYFHGYLNLHGGTLSIEDWYEQNVTFDSFTLRCLPRTIMFATSATSDTVRMDMEAEYLILKPHTELTISNLDFSDAPVPDEYQTYKNFFTDATRVTPPVESALNCPYGTAEVPRPKCRIDGTVGVQCSNNGFP